MMGAMRKSHDRSLRLEAYLEYHGILRTSLSPTQRDGVLPNPYGHAANGLSMRSRCAPSFIDKVGEEMTLFPTKPDRYPARHWVFRRECRDEDMGMLYCRACGWAGLPNLAQRYGENFGPVLAVAGLVAAI